MHLGGRRRHFLSSSANRAGLKRVHLLVHIIFSLRHARTPRVLKYVKEAGRANFRVYLNISEKHLRYRNLRQVHFLVRYCFQKRILNE